VAQVTVLSGPQIVRFPIDIKDPLMLRVRYSFKDNYSLVKPGKFSLQRFNNGLGKDAPVSGRYPLPSIPTYVSSSFPGQNGTFDVMSMVENKLSLGLRRVIVEDNWINHQYHQPSVP